MSDTVALDGVGARGRTGEMLPFGTVVLDLDGTAKMPEEPFNPALGERLAELRRRGVRVMLATGRSVAELRTIVDFGLFDAVVAENGTVQLIGGAKKILAPAEWFPVRDMLLQTFGGGSEEVVVSLDRGLLPDAERVTGSAARVELNKDRIMILPAGFDKGRGVAATLRDMGTGGKVMSIGDGENDLSMFRVSDFRVALDNSVEALKKEADYIARSPDGQGAAEAIDELILRRNP